MTDIGGDPFSTKQNTVRLHLRRRFFEPGAGGPKLVAAREYERPVLRHRLLEAGVGYFCSHYSFGDYGQPRRMDESGTIFEVRLHDPSVIEEIGRIPVFLERTAKGA